MSGAIELSVAPDFFYSRIKMEHYLLLGSGYLCNRM